MKLARVPKQRLKQFVRRIIGEPHVGKRLKQVRVRDVLNDLRLCPSEILDAGTEDATFVYWLADMYPSANVTAVDIDADAIAVCIAACRRATTTASDSRLGRSELPDEGFDHRL